jgi:hypothetical protein
MNISFLLIVIILLTILILSALVFFISADLVCPDYSKKRKTPEEIENKKRYTEKLKKNYPFCSRFIPVLKIIAFFYPFLYVFFSTINVIYRGIGIKTTLYLIGFTAVSMLFLISKANSEYESSDFSFRKEYPNLKNLLNLCLYAASIFLSFIIVHFTNFALDYSKPEEHIVTVTASVHRTTRGSKGGTNHHYELYFEPPIRNLDKIEVNSLLQSQAKTRDKLKIKLQNGVFGIPYINYKNIEVLK